MVSDAPLDLANLPLSLAVAALSAPPVAWALSPVVVVKELCSALYQADELVALQ